MLPARRCLRHVVSKIDRSPASSSTTAYQRRRGVLARPQRRPRHSTSSSSSSSSNAKDPRKNIGGSNDSTSKVSTVLTRVVGAGIGTLTSTTAALYLATIVETRGHELLYGWFPSRYSDVSSDNLPTCLRDREMTRRGRAGRT